MTWETPRLTAAVPAAVSGTETPPGSRAVVVRGLGRGAVQATLTEPGRAVAYAAALAAPYTVRARGALAPGLSVTQLASSGGERRSLSGAVCTEPGTDAWFVGSGAVIGQRGELVLHNTEDAPAELDVVLYGVAGEIDTPSTRRVAVAAGGQKIIKLDAVAPRQRRLAAHVVVRAGRVSAALRDAQTRGLDWLGADWVPAAVAPQRRVVVPGVPAGGGERMLHVVAPGTSDAVVKVRLLALRGPFSPSGLAVLTVAAGTVKTVDLAPYTRGEAVAVELESDVPVTGSLLSRVGRPSGEGELTWTAATPALQAPALLADVGAGRGRSVSLLLSAGPRSATVRLEPIRSGGRQRPRRWSRGCRSAARPSSGSRPQPDREHTPCGSCRKAPRHRSGPRQWSSPRRREVRSSPRCRCVRRSPTHSCPRSLRTSRWPSAPSERRHRGRRASHSSSGAR
jgi:hypothetical protein